MVNWNVWAIQTSHTDQFITGHSTHWFWTFCSYHMHGIVLFLFFSSIQVVLFIFNSWVVFDWTRNKIKRRFTAARARNKINVVIEEMKEEIRTTAKVGKTNRKKEMPGMKGSWKQVALSGWTWECSQPGTVLAEKSGEILYYYIIIEFNSWSSTRWIHVWCYLVI